MALKEHYNADIDSTTVTSSNVYGASIWSAQTFTAEDSTNRASAKVLLFRTGTPGDVTVNIEATTAGKPNGSVLATGVLSGNTITTDAAGEWFEVTFDAPYAVTAATVYAIVVKVLGGDASNKVQWRSDTTSPAYGGGSRIWTSSGGSTYTIDVTKDMGFELDDGEADVVYEDATGTVDIISAATGTPNVSFGAIGTVAIALTAAGTATTAFSATGTVTIVSTLAARAVRVMLRDPLKGVGRLIACGNNELWFEDL